MGKIKKGINVLLSYPSRIFNGTSFFAKVVESKVDKTARIQKNANIRYSKIGRYSYISARTSVIYATIGNFCSIAAGVAIGGGAHDIEGVSTSPLFVENSNIFGKNFANKPYEPYKMTQIGNDVWIGNRAIILQGVKIGNGAVIGAGSVVTKDVSAYDVVAGNPARVIRKRFDPGTVLKLEETNWWSYDDAKLSHYAQYFNTPDHFLKKLMEETN